jgi:hypothetical protein
MIRMLADQGSAISRNFVGDKATACHKNRGLQHLKARPMVRLSIWILRQLWNFVICSILMAMRRLRFYVADKKAESHQQAEYCRVNRPFRPSSTSGLVKVELVFRDVASNCSGMFHGKTRPPEAEAHERGAYSTRQEKGKPDNDPNAPVAATN